MQERLILHCTIFSSPIYLLYNNFFFSVHFQIQTFWAAVWLKQDGYLPSQLETHSLIDVILLCVQLEIC